MEGLTEEQCRRFLKLQEICPNDDPKDLYEGARSHLKSDKEFNSFLNDLMERKFSCKTEEDDEERKVIESLTFAFTKQVPDPFTEIAQKNPKSSFTVRQEKTTKSIRKQSGASLWDNMESIEKDQRGMDELLEEIFEGNNLTPLVPENVKNEEPDSESGESAKACESDSDESFHSTLGEPHHKNTTPVKTIGKNENLYYIMEKSLIMRNEKLRETENIADINPAQTVGTVDKNRISDESVIKEEMRRKMYNGDCEENLAPKTENKKPNKKDRKSVKENNSSGEESENPKKNFSLFNGLIMKKMDDGSSLNSLKPQENLEKKKKDFSTAVEEFKVSSSPGESQDPMSKMIDCFFFKTQEAKEKGTVEESKSDSEKSKSDYEKLGAIPKKIDISKTDRDIYRATSRDSTPFSNTERSAGTGQVEMPLTALDRNSVDKEILGGGRNGFGKKEEVQSRYPEKKSETQVSNLKDLEIPGYPFIYVVSESYSPNFRLPKGNYFISNTFLSVESLGPGLGVLHHPSDIKEKKVEISERRNKPERDSTKKPEVGSMVRHNSTLLNPNAESFRSTLIPSFAQAVRYNDAGKIMGRSTFEASKVKTENIPNSKIKGKIFCNTPLQSLKKEGDDRNDSADAYGAILQSVADDFKSCKKSTQPMKTLSREDDPPSSDPNAFLDALRSNSSESSTKKTNRNRIENAGNDFSYAGLGFEKFGSLGRGRGCLKFGRRDDDKKSVAEKVDVDDVSGSDEENADDDEEEEEDSSDEQEPDSTVMAALRNLDPDYVKGKLENCGNNKELQKKVIEKEVERSLRSDIESQLIREGYLRILKELPTQDPEFLLNKWSEIAGDDAAIDAFIEGEKIKLQLEEIKNKLFLHLPLLDREFLESKAKDFLFDSKELEAFLAEEKKKMIVEQQCELMRNRLPGMDPALLREKCEEFQGNPALVEEFIERKALELKKQEKRNMQIINMHLILPDADPAFLEQKFKEFEGDGQVGGDGELGQAFNNFLYELLESKEYPKVQKDDPASRERAESWRRFVDNFDVKDFLNKIPNPEEHYCGSKGENNKTDIGFISKFLQSRYPESTVQDLERVFRERRCNLTNACAQLDSETRPVEIMDVSFRNENIPESFLLEMVFIQHRQEIRDYIREEKELRNFKVAAARTQNSLLACACCFEDELLETDVTTCADGHIFCIDCVTRSVETKLSDGDTKFPCLTDQCSTEFTLAILEKILPSNLYAKVLRKKQSAEVTEAKVPGLETCPSCDFAYIPSRNDKIFKCQNQDCLRETCRQCKEESHVPLRCEEVERPKDTVVRTEIEEKMTEALVRTCPQCGKKFVKTDGCNKMTCTCGATSCYLCRKLVKDYRHFNGQGGDRFDLCPLFSNNDDLHVGAVRRVGVLARDEALRQNPDLHLVHDPTQTL